MEVAEKKCPIFFINKVGRPLSLLRAWLNDQNTCTEFPDAEKAVTVLCY